MSVRTPEVVSSAPKSDLAANHTRKWALWFAGIAVAVWLFYVFAVPNLGAGPQTFIREWMPLGSINEALVWVICAVGLNIVVGYAGLLDLGFVAFWAIGGYTAGWFMSTFIQAIQNGFYFLSAAPPGQPGIHLNWWIVLVLAGCICAGGAAVVDTVARRENGCRATAFDQGAARLGGRPGTRRDFPARRPD